MSAPTVWEKLGASALQRTSSVICRIVGSPSGPGDMKTGLAWFLESTGKGRENQVMRDGNREETGREWYLWCAWNGATSVPLFYHPSPMSEGGPCPLCQVKGVFCLPRALLRRGSVGSPLWAFPPLSSAPPLPLDNTCQTRAIFPLAPNTLAHKGGQGHPSDRADGEVGAGELKGILEAKG